MRVAIIGAAGRMGKVLIEAVDGTEGLELGAAIVEPIRAPVIVRAPVTQNPTPPPVIAPVMFGDNSVGVRRNDGRSWMDDWRRM